MTIAVTLDFHNTLAKCDRWFGIEVFSLVSDVIGWLDLRDGTAWKASHAIRADCMYREIRREVVESGVERDAVSCAILALKRLELDVDDQSVSVAVDHVMRNSLDDVRPLDGALETVGHLTNRGIPVGIVSSAAYHPFLEWVMVDFGIADRVTTIVSSAGCGFYKSRHDIYLFAARELGVDPSRCVHVGDSYPYDVASAGRAGMKTCWLRADGDRPAGPPPDLAVDTLVGLGPKLLELFDDR